MATATKTETITLTLTRPEANFLLGYLTSVTHPVLVSIKEAIGEALAPF